MIVFLACHYAYTRACGADYWMIFLILILIHKKLMKKEFAIFSTLLFVFFDTIVLTSQALVRTTSNDYAIIINTGRDVTNNHDYYWNDCSEIYKLLMVCGYDRNNIYVLMSDGKSTGQDMNMGNGVYQDSPRDLDGDGADDVSEPATSAID